MYGLFETSITNDNQYANPFTDAEVEAVFTAPSGRMIHFFGFYDGDGRDGQRGTVWKQRFMPDEVGTWTYVISFTDGAATKSGSFEVVSSGSKPGPWRPNPENPHWLMTARGEHFLPTAVYMHLPLATVDWKDGIEWALARGYNTILTPTLNPKIWGDGWPNPTPFIKETGDPAGTASGDEKRVNYDYLNLKAWRDWDRMIQAVGDAGLYIAPADSPSGDWGGQSGVGTIVPPAELAYFPKRLERYDTADNLWVLRYFVARQAAFWNIAYWSLYSTEIFDVKERDEVIAFGEYLASITPFNRMITAQDIEQKQDGFGESERDWLSAMEIPDSRKLNTIQLGPIDNTDLQDARLNNIGALDAYHGYPVFATETLWEGQPRAEKPLRMIWGSLTAGAHTLWADWRDDRGDNDTRWISLGRAWTPLKPLEEHLFKTDQLGADTVGDEQLVIATAHLRSYDYWRMNPHNELVAGSKEAYCLAEPARQYLVYAPRGGLVRLDLRGTDATFEARWLNPATGEYSTPTEVPGGLIHRFFSPNSQDWVLDVRVRG